MPCENRHADDENRVLPMSRELNVSGVYRVPAASLAKQTTLSTQGSPDVELVYGGAGRLTLTA